MSRIKAAIYLRISLDQTGEGLAVERQRQDCLAIAEARNFEVVEIYSDSVSASNKNIRRPNYERMVEDYKNGRFTAVVCYDLDRLTRQVRQLEDWIEWATEKGLHLITANGEADLSTDGGRMYATIKVAVARAEVERKGERQKRALKQRAELGRPPKGTRLTGYDQQGNLIPSEAKVVKEVFEEFLRGEPLKALARRMTDSGIPTRNGTPWNPSTIRGILTNARYCGRSVYKGQEIGAKGNWEAVVSEDVFDLVKAKLSDESRKKNREGTERKHLGSGLFRCSVCGDKLRTSSNRYWCPKGGHVLRTMSHVDEFVLALIAARLDEPDVVGRMFARNDEQQIAVEQTIEQLQKRLAVIESDYDNELIDGKRFKVASDKIKAELESIQKSRASQVAGRVVAEAIGSANPGNYFLTAPLGTKRTLIDSLAIVSLRPGQQGQKGFKPESVAVEWRTF